LDLRGLKTGGGAGDIATDLENSGRLKAYTAAPRLGFQLKLPATFVELFDGAGNIGEGEGALLVAKFEIDAAILELNFLEMVGGFGRRLRAVPARACVVRGVGRRKLVFQIPAALGIADENQAWTSERHGAKFETSAENAGKAKAGGHGFRAKKILVAEGRIFANGDVVDEELRDGQNLKRKTASIHGTSKGALEVRNEIDPHAVGFDQGRDSNLGRSQRQHQQRERPNVFLGATHD
jgi:hypothetical protein